MVFPGGPIKGDEGSRPTTRLVAHLVIRGYFRLLSISVMPWRIKKIMNGNAIENESGSHLDKKIRPLGFKLSGDIPWPT